MVRKGTEDPTEDDWAVRVGDVFNTAPRIGVGTTLWIPRRQAESQLEDAFRRVAKHVCVDGPSGTGKSSLALTHLEKHKHRYCEIQLTRNTTWRDFCRELVLPSVVATGNKKSSRSLEFEAGLDRGLPTSKFRVRLGDEGRQSDDFELLESMAASWTEHDVARRLVAEQTALLVDDFERASDEMVQRLADLAKVLNQSHVHPKTKIVFIGTADTYRRLYDERDALEHRLAGVSLGPLENEGESWRFLTEGFDSLGIRHPGTSRFDRQTRQVPQCIAAVYEAADSLPKSVNQLGQDIALKARDRKAVSAFDIISQARRMADQNWAIHRRNFKAVLKVLENSYAAVQLIKTLFEQGVCRIHDSILLADLLQGHLSEKEAEKAVQALVDAKFIIRTGPSGGILYVANPTAAHTLGVALSSPKHFKGAEQLLARSRQIAIAFPERQMSQVPPRDDTDDV